MDDPSGRVAGLQDEIAQTRAQMSETIDALHERLSPSRVAARTRETLAARLRANPVAAYMVGATLAFLMVRRRRARARQQWRGGAIEYRWD